MEHELKEFIKECDLVVRQEGFDTQMNCYLADAFWYLNRGDVGQRNGGCFL